MAAEKAVPDFEAGAIDVNHSSARSRAIISASMEDRAEILRRRIALYRRYLREGVDLGLAVLFFTQIAADEAELAGIEEIMRETNAASFPQIYPQF